MLVPEGFGGLDVGVDRARDGLVSSLCFVLIDDRSILVYSGFFLPEQHASHIELLKQKADDGASIRILLGDPDSPQVALKGQEEDIGDAIAAKIRNVLLAYYMPRRCGSESSTTWTRVPSPTWAEQRAVPQHARRW